jgi:general secretion pathway protein G
MWPHERRRGCSRKRGFTLLELLVVLLIIALLAGYVGPKLFSQVEQAKVKTARAQMKTLADALGQYRLDTGRYPSEQEGLDVLVKQPAGAQNWHGPYLSKDVPLDPWSNAYQFKSEGDKHEIVSLGSDGKPGGTGDAADIVYEF